MTEQQIRRIREHFVAAFIAYEALASALNSIDDITGIDDSIVEDALIEASVGHETASEAAFNEYLDKLTMWMEDLRG